MRKTVTSNIMTLSTEDLKVDKRYQRDLRVSRVKKIVREYNPNKLGVLIVSKRLDGSYWVVDGWHRVNATTQYYGEPHAMECKVFEGLTYEEECELFYSQDDNKSTVRPLEKFPAMLGAKNEEAIRLNKCLDEVGVKVARGSGKNSVRCLKLMFSLVKSLGEKDFKRMMVVIKDSFGGADDTFNGSLVGGMGVLFSTYADVLDDKKAIKRFQRVTVKDILQRGRLLDSSVKDGVARALFNEYNKKDRNPLERRGMF